VRELGRPGGRSGTGSRALWIEASNLPSRPTAGANPYVEIEPANLA
jgi:hypothetical protein